MVAHTYNSSTQETEAGGSKVAGQPGATWRDPFSKAKIQSKNKTKINKKWHSHSEFLDIFLREMKTYFQIRVKNWKLPTFLQRMCG
jgi:hypothetical protein